MGGAVRLRDLSFSYDAAGARLRNLNLTIRAGEVVVITGASGSGKSTITRLINGLIPQFYEGQMEGDLEIEGVARDAAFYERGRRIGNVFQDPRSQFFANEVAGEIAFGCENYGYAHDDIVRRVEDAARRIGLSNVLEERVRTLSYGMRQKVAIASARAMGPEIYVMDEPSANLDVEATHQLAGIIRGLKDEGRTVVVTEHRLYYLMDIADRFLHLRDGAIAGEFTNAEFRGLAPDSLRDMGLRTPDLYDCRADFDGPAPGEEEVRAVDLVKRFGATPVLNGVDFTIRKGESVALIGDNGVGKSTIGRILAGLVKEDRGMVRIDGRRRSARGRIGGAWYIPQDLDSWLFGDSLLDELLTGGPRTPERRARALEVLGLLDLDAIADQHPATLSGGQKQRLALGVALIHRADLIIMDEPTSGLDGRSMRRVGDLVRRLSAQGRTILIISHDAECVLHCCGRAILIEDGRVAEDFRIDSAQKLLDRMGYRRLRGAPA